jgi:exoribonuclease R
MLRGAGYLSFEGGVPEQPGHAALAATYAHATAPLRRLVDRYVGEVCLALCADRAMPQWITHRLPELPATMTAARRRVASFERAVLDLVEAGLLADRVGETFPAVVVEVEDDDARRGVVVVPEPAVEASVLGAEALPLGKSVQVRLAIADPASRRVVFELDG